jgi:hypothetical protein
VNIWKFYGDENAIEYHGGTVAEDYTLIEDTDATGTVLSTEVRQLLARDKTLATMFVMRSDQTRYGTLLADLSNNFAMGKDEYPHDLSAAYTLLVNYVTQANARIKEQHKTHLPWSHNSCRKRQQ